MMNLLVGLLVFWLVLVIAGYLYNILVGPMFGRTAIAPFDLVLLMLLVVAIVWAANHFNYWGYYSA